MEDETEKEWWPEDTRLQYRLCSLGGTLINQELFLNDEYAPDNLPEIVELCGEQVTAIEVMGEEWGDRHLEQFQRLPRLEALRLSQCSRLTDEGLLYLAQVRSLQRLDLGGVTATGLTPAGFNRLGRLPQLDFLRLPRSWPCPPAEDLTRARTDAAVAALQAVMPNTIIRR